MSQLVDEKFEKLNQEEKELYKLRHTAEHVLHQAVKELYPHIHLAMGPATDEGFYFDFDASPVGNEPVKISEADFPKIEKRMKKIIQRNLPLIRLEMDVTEAKALFSDNPYKLEWIESIKSRGEKISVYWTGEPNQKGSMVDLCSGPHAASTGAVKAFKLLSVAGAYWHGDEKNKMLTRIYGTAYANKEDLNEHLWRIEEAKKRDHRKIGKEQELFFIDDTVGKGLVMWLPNGQIIRDEIEMYAKEKEKSANYQRVTTPHIAKEELFLKSGHLPYYKEDMYPPMVMDDGTYYLKAMNCPHHHQIYLHKPRSYRDLPIRIAEYGTCYRNELSGTLAGLLRVRAMAMNDAHIYCKKEQIRDEIKSVIQLTQEYFETFGLDEYWFRLSKWDPQRTDKYFNEPENWEVSQDIIRQVLLDLKVNFIEADDEAAFYGPKVDVQFTSVIGREETMSTIQLDFAAKDRFGLSYTDSTGSENNEVYVIHRAPLSVHERFLAFLIEHFAGAFPFWLSPVQFALMPVGDVHAEKANDIAKTLSESKLRAEVFEPSESLGKRIRTAEKQKIPFIGVIGDKEQKDDTIAIRSRGNNDLGSFKIADMTEKLRNLNHTRSLDLKL